MKTFLERFVGSDRGASMVEYGLMVALIALIAIPAIAMVGYETEATFDTVAESLADAEGAGAEAGADGVEDESPAPEDGDDTPAPGGDDDDDAPAPGGDDDDDDDAPAPGGDDDDDDDAPAPGGDDDDDDDAPAPGGDDDEPTAADPGSEAVVASTGSSFYWWNSSKHGGEGAWKATVNYTNDHNRHQYLTLEITRTDDNGKTTITRVNDFYVSANGNATFELWDNNLKVHQGKTTGTVSVEVKVVSVTTADQNWNPVTYPQYGNSTTVGAPKP